MPFQKEYYGLGNTAPGTHRIHMYGHLGRWEMVTLPFRLQARVSAPRGLVPAPQATLRAGVRGTLCISLASRGTQQNLYHFEFNEKRKM